MTSAGADHTGSRPAPGSWWVFDPTRLPTQPVALLANGDEANDMLAGADNPRYLAFWPATEAQPQLPDLADTVAMLDLAPEVAMHVELDAARPTATGPTWPSADDLATALAHARADGLDAHRASSAMVARTERLVGVGGFDPAFAGLAWADVVTRLAADGLVVTGIDPQAAPFIDGLDGTLSVRRAVANTARWWRRHSHRRPGEGGPERYRALVLAATHLARTGAAATNAGDGPAPTNDGLLAEIAADAQDRWREPPPHESQVGVGRRADWRALLREARYDTVCILDGSTDQDHWSWLVDDGWATTVTTSIDDGHNADVVVRASTTVDLGRAAALVSPQGTLCVLALDPLPALPARATGLRTRRRLRQLGFTTRRYLAVPDARHPRRFIPLDHPGGMDWFLSSGPAASRHRISARNRWRRRLVRRGRAVLPRLLGDVVLIANRHLTGEDDATVMGLDSDVLGTDVADAIVITSGFDEGSRSVLLPLPAPAGRNQATEPARVVKVASRPAYNGNVDREHELLTDLTNRVGPTGPLPRPGVVVSTGPLRASSESYAGRWTMTDILNEQQDRSDRVRLLTDVLASVTHLGTTSGVNLVPWSGVHYQRLIAEPLDALSAALDRPDLIGALSRRLAERSAELEGVLVPFVGRHHDLGPWNVVIGSDGPVLVDWELGPPRTFEPTSFAGADQLYLTRYWLHIVMACESVDDELSAFPFLADRHNRRDPRHDARSAMATVAAAVDLDRRFLPLVEAHVWAEAACYTMGRRADRGGDAGSPGRYVLALARHRDRLVASSG